MDALNKFSVTLYCRNYVVFYKFGYVPTYLLLGTI